MDPCRSSGVVRFGLFEVDPHLGQLRKDGIRIRLQEQPFHVLAVLLERPGELITREELRHAVWPENTFVEFDHALNTAIKKIRAALNDDAATPRYIETIPKRGYRWIAPLHRPQDSFVAGNGAKTGPSAIEHPSVSRPVHRSSGGLTVLGVILGAIVLAGFVGFSLVRGGTAHGRGGAFLVVLPLENWSEDSGVSSLCRGLTEELIAQLAALNPSGLRVAANATALQYEHSSKSALEIARELGADFVLQGNVRGTREHVRVSAELIRVRDQARLWGENFDRGPGDPVQLEGDLARSISASMRSALVAAAP
jgi:DNA-binding winged helix-turn-helix (wHTH) protein/TolB-like protein